MFCRMVKGIALAALATAVAIVPAEASLDHDDTVWAYEADGSDFPGNGSAVGTNETVDADGTKLNGWAYFGGSDWNLDDPNDKWDLDPQRLVTFPTT